MFLLKSLCTGTSSMSKTDISTFTAILKFAKVPSIIRSEKETGMFTAVLNLMNIKEQRNITASGKLTYDIQLF